MARTVTDVRLQTKWLVDTTATMVNIMVVLWWYEKWWLWNYNDAEVSLQAGSGVCWLGWSIGWSWSIGGVFIFRSSVVVVPVMLSVTLVSVRPLELNSLTRGQQRSISGNNCSPWLWMCGPSVRDIPLCYGLGSPSCSPTRRWRVQERLYIGNGCLQRSSRQLLV